MSLINVEMMIAADHPIRTIKRMRDAVLLEMIAHFDEIYAAKGAPSIPPEALLKAEVLQSLCTVPSDRHLCARLQTDLMFRWFVDLPLDEAVFDTSSRVCRGRFISAVSVYSTSALKTASTGSE